MNIYEIVPLLHAIQQAGEINEVFSTIMIPYEKDNYQYLQKHSNKSFQSIQYNLNQNSDQYTITFRYKKFKSSFLQNEGYNYIEIENINRERNLHRKNLQIKILSRSLKKIFEDTNLQGNEDGEQGSLSPRSPQMVNKLRTRIVNTIMKNIIEKNKEILDKESGYNQSKSLNKQTSAFTKQASLSSFMNQNVIGKSTITLQQVSQHDGNETVSDEESAIQINSNSMHFNSANNRQQDNPQSTRRLDQTNDQSHYQFYSTANQNFEESISSNREILSPPFGNNNISIQNLLDASNQFQNETFTSRRLNESPPLKHIQLTKSPLFSKPEENKLQKSQKQDRRESGFFNIVTILKNKKDSESKNDRKDQKILNKQEQNMAQSSNLFSLQEISTNFHQQSTQGLELESPTITMKQQSLNKKVKLPNETNEDINKGKLQLAAYQSSFHDNLDQHRKSSEYDIQASDLNPQDELHKKNLSSRKFDDFDNDENQYQNSEEIVEDQKNEIASVNSSKFSQAELSKRIIISHIKSANANSGLVFMLYTGIFSFFVMIILSFILSNKGYSSLMDYKNDYNKIDIAVSLLINVLDVIKTKSYGDLTQVDRIFGDKDDSFDAEQKKIADDENIEQIKDYLENLTILLSDVNSDEQMNKLTKEITEIQIFSQFNVFSDDPDSTNIYQAITQQPLNLIEFIHFFYEQIYQYFAKFEPQQEHNLFNNIENFHTLMVELQKIIETEVQNSFNSMENQQITIIVIILVVSTVLVLIVVPISIFVKKQKEEIYKLVGSFNPQHLQNQIDNIESILHKLETYMFNQISQKEQNQDINFKISKQMKVKINQSPQLNSQMIIYDYQDENQKNQSQNNQNQTFSYISRVSNKRNRTIASFSSIKKINYFLIVGLLLVVGIIMIQPSLNYLILTPFLEEQKIVLKERILILDITSQLIRNQAPNYQNLWMILSEGLEPKSTLYYEFIKNQTQINFEQMNRIQQIIGSAKVPRRNQNEYNDFYLKIMNDNICEAKKQYPNYFNYTKQDSECETLFSGIFKRGFLITLQHSYQQFSLYEELYELDNKQSSEQFLQLQDQMQFYSLHQTIKLLSQTVKSIKFFQDACNKEYVNYIINTFFTLFIVQIALVSIIFSLGWSFLFKIFTRELKESKQIFTLFHINILYQNQFITKYLKQKQSLLQY